MEYSGEKIRKEQLFSNNSFPSTITKYKSFQRIDMIDSVVYIVWNQVKIIDELIQNMSWPLWNFCMTCLRFTINNKLIDP